MNEEQMPTLSLRLAYAFGAAHKLEREINEIRGMEIEWDRPYTSSLRRGFIVELFEKNGLFEEFKAKCWPYGNTKEGEAKRRRSVRIKQQYDEFLSGRGGEIGLEESDEEEVDREFAAESDLRDFLSKNLTRIEPGPRLFEDSDRSGVEFPVGGRFIDILARDAKDNYVVVELKVSRGYDRAVGQLLRYMAWVQANLAGGKPVRGVIVASGITDDLKLAASLVPNVRLFQYEIEFRLKPLA